MPLKVWPNTALGCNHQSICMPSYSLYVQLLWYPMYYPEGMNARVSPVQWSKPYSILDPTQDSNPGGQIQNHKRWPLHYHCACIIKGYLLSTVHFFRQRLWIIFLWSVTHRANPGAQTVEILFILYNKWRYMINQDLSYASVFSRLRISHFFTIIFLTGLGDFPPGNFPPGDFPPVISPRWFPPGDFPPLFPPRRFPPLTVTLT